MAAEDGLLLRSLSAKDIPMEACTESYDRYRSRWEA